ncbi:MAG: sulfotransferase [bacterium]|nr:sulfotransferase [bacterium]
MQTPPIIYITGLGHSGSTLLDLLLDSHSQTRSVGELAPLSSAAREGHRESVLRKRRCVCGAASKFECPFWGEVDRRLRKEHGTSLLEIDVGAPDRDAFIHNNQVLYATLAAVSGCRFVIDSSKRRRRLKRLIETGFDVRPIHLVREPHGVVYSNVRKGRSWFDHTIHYNRQTIQTHRLLADHHHLFVRYEDLATDPEATVRRIVAWLGLDFEPEQMQWNTAEHHNLAGNRMRFSGDATIRFDREWKSGLSFLQRQAISLLTLRSRLLVRGGGDGSGEP